MTLWLTSKCPTKTKMGVQVVVDFTNYFEKSDTTHFFVVFYENRSEINNRF